MPDLFRDHPEDQSGYGMPHHFCGECIDKAMRLGNNECPACRTHCASRRSLIYDPNYDALIAVLYPDIDKCEAEELEFDEEGKARNEQIQASIVETSRQQSEAKGRKRYKRGGGEAQVSRSSLAESSSEGGTNDNEPEVNREMVSAWPDMQHSACCLGNFGIVEGMTGDECGNTGK